MEQQSHTSSESSWEIARKYAARLGTPPDMLALCTRSLLRNQASRKEDSTIDFRSEYLLTRLLRSATMRSKIYFAAYDLEPKKIPQSGTWSLPELCRLFTPFEYATLISLIALHLQAKKKCNSEDWGRLSPLLYTSCNLGYQLGRSIKAIGPAIGLLIGSMRYIVFSVFASVDSKKLREYRRTLKSKDIPYDLDAELQIFGCTHPQVISVLLQRLGFGVSYTHLIEQALGDQSDKELSREATPIRVVSLWLDSLLMKGTPPETDLGDEYDMTDADLDTFLNFLNEMNENPGKTHWLTRGKADTSPEATPHLFSANGNGHEKVNGNGQHPPTEKSEGSLEKHFSDEELATINSDAQELGE